VGADFYGVFCGNNTPDPANFPSGVTYQRAANWTTHTLLSTDNVTPVASSIDPFFFHWTDQVIARGPIGRQPIERKPILRTPIERKPIIPQPPEPIVREPIGPKPGQEPTDIDL